MLLGGSLTGTYADAAAWVADAAAQGYAATPWPLAPDAGEALEREFARAAREAKLCVAEVGVWKNTLSPDDAVRRASMAHAKACLAAADRIGARCCVNISGARGDVWDAGYADNYSEDTHALIVDSVREIIDAVKPTRTFYTLEPMPWMSPDSADDYLRLIRDVDRPAFGVHMDFVNMMNTPRRFLLANEYLTEWFEKLAPYIMSTHIKDLNMEVSRLPVTLRECAPGLGKLDYRFILRLIDRTLPSDAPVMLEHMRTAEEYAQSLAYVKGVAVEIGVPVSAR